MTPIPIAVRQKAGSLLAIIGICLIFAGLTLCLIASLKNRGKALAHQPGQFNGPARPQGAHQEYSDVPVSIENRTSKAITLLGAQEFCGSSGCILVNGLPLRIQPHSHATLVVGYCPPFAAGDFQLKISLFTDSPQYPIYPIELFANVLPPPRQQERRRGRE